MKPYVAMLSARFRAQLQYRAAALAGLGTQFFWGLIRVTIFTAFLEHSAAQSPMTLDQVIAYIWLGQAFLLLIPFRGDAELEDMVRTGNVAYEMLRPVNVYNLWFARGIANRVAPVLLRCVPMLVVVTLLGWIHWPRPAVLVAFAASIVAATLLASAIATLMTLTLFWTISGQGINRLAFAFMWIFSGIIIPLPLFPDWLQPVLNALPFRGLCDMPFRLFTGHIPLGQAPSLLAHQLAWTLALVLLGRWIMIRASRRLVVQGG
ncbi:MAG: ABC-2 family transporter protein [Phycisphaerae bacterium]|nr:ABC-2 family transporter protein [Phycisphaerae bacterium]